MAVLKARLIFFMQALILTENHTQIAGTPPGYRRDAAKHAS